MQPTLQALLGLQEIDREIYRVERELERLPAELSKRRAELDQKVRELEDVRASVAVLRTEIKEIEHLISQQRQRVRKLESEASGNKADMALLAAYDHEIRGLKRNIGDAEEEALRKMEQVERNEEAIRYLEQALAGERSTFEEYRGNVERELRSAEERLAELRSRAEGRMSEEIAPAHLSLYRNLLTTRDGEALAELDGQVCQGCYVSIPKNLVVRLMRGNELVQCPSCDRILVVRS